MIMSQAEREQAIQAVYALGSLAQVIDIPRLSRTLRTERIAALDAGQRPPQQFMMLLEVLDAAMWLREATALLNEEQQSRAELQRLADDVAPDAAQEQPIPEDWAPASPAAG